MSPVRPEGAGVPGRHGLPFVYRVTRYDPTDRDERGARTGTEDVVSDHGPGEQRPADDLFWERLSWCVATGWAGLLEENHVDNGARWHRLDDGLIDVVRGRLAPRAQLTVWPGLSTDVAAVLAALPEEGPVELVWEDGEGRITGVVADGCESAELATLVAGARAATALSRYVDERHPLMTAVLPDSDDVLRARRWTEQTRSDRDWAFLRTLRRGQVVTGTVVVIADFGVTFVDIGGFTAMINIPEVSWRRVGHPSDILAVGQEVTAEILDIDPTRERVSLSLKALQEDPLPRLAERVGETVTGRVTRIEAFGVFVRIEERDDGFEGLVPASEPAGDTARVGDPLTVRITAVDPTTRRILLAPVRASATGEAG